ncbi:alpha/beta hydrolase [Natrinema sp. 1APR25-10V2]|uniref:alpha/beta hydrolase n=1 Tax=Natrinema sp. 1APR25-10V2 TaxID=2951081 RepID=UPI002874FDCC|nr:alpha/beta hydrolase [Natrinema sp. 1APR25-10V2]MDS0473922.1 alpha/beta hydrolase [Natrinema sp. 1APR25-10V2]
MAPRRRTVLAAVSTATASAVAGCSDLLAEQTSDDGPTAPTDVATALIDDIANENFERASKRFVERERGKRGDPARLERLWMAYGAVSGSFAEVVDTETRTKSNRTAVDLTLSFERGDHDFRVIADGKSRLLDCGIVDGYVRPSYVEPNAITERDVTLSVADCSLPGTVTTPESDSGNAPGVVLVHDAGAGTRNNDRGGTKAFKDLAEGLTSKGIAVLRYDKRIPACEVKPDSYTLDRVIVDDALVAVERLRNVEGVAADRIVVVGHGLGGRAAPRIAARDGSLAGVVGLAAPARPYHDLTLEQLEHKVSVGSLEWDDLANIHDRWTGQIERVRSGDYEPTETLLGYPGAFWDSLAAYDHLETAAGLDVPAYFLQGERDFQVSVADDLERWRSELGEGSDVAFDTYGDLDHLFMPGEGASVEFAYTVRNNVAEGVVDDLANWIDEL